MDGPVDECEPQAIGRGVETLAELAALAEALDVPVAHTLMGKGCLPDGHPLLVGQTGFWGTPISNDRCRTADLIVAVGTRLAEANSSSWDPRFTFSIPPTRLFHIDADEAERLSETLPDRRAGRGAYLNNDPTGFSSEKRKTPAESAARTPYARNVRKRPRSYSDPY